MSKFAGLEIKAQQLQMQHCPAAEFQRLMALLAQRKIAFTRVKYGYGNLEELFLHLTKRQLRD